MWYAVTAHPVNLKKSEKKKEFYRGDIVVIINADTRENLELKLKETFEKYPQEMIKYLRAGIKFIKASNIVQAKIRSKEVSIYFDQKGQYHLF
jgi:hypothetical protein